MALSWTQVSFVQAADWHNNTLFSHVGWDPGPPRTWPGPAPRVWAPNNDHRPLLLPPPRAAPGLPPLANILLPSGVSQSWPRCCPRHLERFGKRIATARIFKSSQLPESGALAHTLWRPPWAPAGFLQQVYWKFGASLSVSLEKKTC